MIGALTLLAALAPDLLTVPEKTNFANTSSYADVTAFLAEVAPRDPRMRVEWIGKSPLGKPIPLVIWSNDPKISPAEARRKDKLVLYIQANIHAGEVEGKESVLMLLRELAAKKHEAWARDAVLLFTPIYNIDGNDSFGPALRNRGHQDGPDPVGERANGDGFDLNRDCIKLDTPEMRSVLNAVYNRWDPHLTMDLHTTNGTRHGYLLTYAPALNPAMDPAIYAENQRMLERIRTKTKPRGYELFDYGDFSRGKWQTFACDPRFVTNYVGVRNRFAVLSEAASFQPFKTRIEVTLAFVKDTIDESLRQKRTILRMTAAADARMKSLAETQIPVRFELAKRRDEPVILEDADPANPIPPNKPPVKFKTVPAEVWTEFKGNRMATLPRAYLIPGDQGRVARLLSRHGIQLEQVSSAREATGSRFMVGECVVAPIAFQGRKLIRLEGRFEPVRVALKPGDWVVRTDQPLGNLAFHILEPESLDGAAAWGFLGDSLPAGAAYPVAKLD
jgi:hypothetical protein